MPDQEEITADLILISEPYRVWVQVPGPWTAGRGMQLLVLNANSFAAKVTVTAYGTYVFRWTEVKWYLFEQFNCISDIFSAAISEWRARRR